MRIAYLTEVPPPQVNGTVSDATRAIRHLRASGHQVQWIRPLGLDEIELDNANEWRCPEGAMSVHRELRRRWRDDAPDLVHVAASGALAWAALAAAKSAGIPATADFRGPVDRGDKLLTQNVSAPFARLLSRRLHRLADGTFVPTAELAQRLGQQGYRDVEVVRRGVDANAFSPAWRDAWLRRAWHADQREPVLLWVGQLAPGKNAELALDTFERLRRERPSVRLVVVGDGPLRRRLERLHPKAFFVGDQRGTELARHCASADILLYPNLASRSAGIVLEAMASGLAVVAFDNGAAAQHVSHGRTGWLVSGGAAGFGAAVRDALAHAAPESAMRVAAREAALRAEWTAPLRSFEQHLRAVATRTARQPLHAAALA